MSNFSNKHIKMVVNESKQESHNDLKMQVEKNKKDIKGCTEERIKNDKDIDAIRFAITSNQKIIKDMLEKMEALEDALAERKSDTMVVSDQDSDSDSMEVLVTDDEQD